MEKDGDYIVESNVQTKIIRLTIVTGMFDVCCGRYCRSNGVVVVTKTDILCRKITKISRT